MLAAAVGLVAVVVDTIAVTCRSPALAGLPLLALYAVPVSVVADGVAWLCVRHRRCRLARTAPRRRPRTARRLGAACWAPAPSRAPDRERRPGRPEPLGAVGRRIGIAAVALAVLVPAIAPRPRRSGARPRSRQRGRRRRRHRQHDQPVRRPGARLCSSPSDNESCTYTADDISPDYLRLVDARHVRRRSTWIPASLKTSGHVDRDPLPYPPGLDSTIAATPGDDDDLPHRPQG